MSDLFTGIANFTKTVSSTLNSYEIRKIGDKVQGYVMNFTEAETKVREATNEDPWGPTGPQMQELAGLTFQYDVFPEIMGMLWKRMLQENKVAWRRVYKSLVLLNYLLKNGSERVISTARDHMFEMRSLENYKCLDERGKDEGVNVRHRVKLVLELLQDDELLRVERCKAKTESREKYQGFSKDEMLYKGKVLSFDNWNVKSTSSDDRLSKNGSESKSGREITAFDFADGRGHSPELGIPDRSSHADAVDDGDDGFGEFFEARSQTSYPGLSKTSTTDTILPIAPPKKVDAAVQEQDLFSFSVSNNVGGAPPDTGNESKSDLFSLPFLPQTTPDPTPNNCGNGGGTMSIDDIFGAPISSPPFAANTHSNNLFSIENDSTSAHNTAESSDTFDFFGSVQTSALAHHTFNTEAPVNGCLLDLVTPPPVAFPIVVSASPTPTSNNYRSQSNTSTTPKLPNTWEDLKGKVNIDFDNLSLRPSPSKPTPTLHELQSRKKRIQTR